MGSGVILGNHCIKLFSKIKLFSYLPTQFFLTLLPETHHYFFLALARHSTLWTMRYFLIVYKYLLVCLVPSFAGWSPSLGSAPYVWSMGQLGPHGSLPPMGYLRVPSWDLSSTLYTLLTLPPCSPPILLWPSCMQTISRPTCIALPLTLLRPLGLCLLY